jgi:hypothetical protein
MLKIGIFWIISVALSYMELKRINKKKRIKDKIMFIIFMCLAVSLVSLHFSEMKLPYMMDIVDLVTKPATEPLSKWLEGFQQK